MLYEKLNTLITHIFVTSPEVRYRKSLNTGVPGFSPPPTISPPGGEIPRIFAPPPPPGNSPPLKTSPFL